MPMRRSWSVVSIATLAAVLLAAFVSQQSVARECVRQAIATPGADVKILVSNDVHGYVETDAASGRIGYPLLKARQKSWEMAGFQTYLLDAGDAFSGSIAAQFDSGKSVAELIGMMGYRVMTPGNHAFDYNGPENDPLYYSSTLVPAVKRNSPIRTDVSAINLRYQGATLPNLIAAPVIIHDDTRTDPDGLRIAVVGVLTPSVVNKINRAALADFDFMLAGSDGQPDHQATKQALLSSLADAVKEFDRPQDVVIALSHVGWDNTDDYAHGQVSGRDLASIANIDFVVDAHSHNRVGPDKLGNVWYCIAGRYLEAAAELTISCANGLLTTHMNVIDYSDVKADVPDAAIVAAIAALVEKMDLDEPLFTLAEPLSDDNINIESTALGRLIGWAQAEPVGADLALVNSGGIRSGLAAGTVTVQAVRNAYPFQNNLLVLEMTGQQLLDLLNSLPDRFTNGFPQLYGMTIHGWTEGEGGQYLRVAGAIDKHGEPVEPDKTYRIAINDYLFAGGDGYALDYVRQVENAGDTVNLMLEQMRKHRPPLERLGRNPALIIHPDKETAMEQFSAAL
ncbi:MAG: 5'-nucleotidase C-terminal domain-containing protein [Planctomycetes bacterium]|nr:5'-nucleotidase C-terminal domain-containing protein [Planctomycetota bacterium]